MKEIDSEGLDTNELNLEELDTEELDTEELDTEELDTEESDTEESDTEESDTEESNTEELQSEELESKGLNFKPKAFKDFNFKNIKFKGLSLEGKNFRGLDFKGLKINSIRFKLILFFSGLVLTSLILVGRVSIQRFNESVTQDTETSLIRIAEDASKLTQSRLETHKKTLDMIALIPDVNTMDWEIQGPILLQKVSETDFLDIAVVDMEGNALYTDGKTAQLGDREYIKKALSGESNVSDVLVSRVTYDVVLMTATPIRRDGEVVGALIGRRDGNALSEITDDTRFGESGYSFIINKTGAIMADRDRDKVRSQFNPIYGSIQDERYKSEAELFEKMLEEKSGVSIYSFEENEYYAGYSPIEGTDWIFAVTAYKDEILSSVTELQQVMNRIIVIAIAVSVVFVYIIASSISGPIVVGVKHAKEIASLNLMQKVPESHMKRKDEIGQLAQALQTITDALGETITEISNTASQVLSASEELSSTSQQSASTAAQIAQTINEIAKGAADQAERTQEGSINANELGRLGDDNQIYMRNLNNQSDKVSEVVKEGLTEIDGLYKITEENNKATLEVKDVIVQTNDSSKRIGQVSNVISSIAQQTNLLALNAAIEAARAGNAGRGFAVVAEEIKNLSLQSSQSTKEIDSIVSELLMNAQNAVKTIERGLAITEEQTKSVNRNKDKYLLIDKAMQETRDTVHQLNISSEQMNKSTEQILESMEGLSAIAEENSAATEQASASIQEDAASAEEISATSEGLTILAKGLQSLIQKFNI